GDPNVVGRKLTLDGHSVEIIGVTPPSFFGPEVGRFFDIAVPLCMEDTLRGERSMLHLRYGWWLSVIGRLKPGWTIERASTHLDALSAGLLETTLPPTYPPESQAKYMRYRLAAYSAGTGLSELRQYSSPLYFLAAIAALLLLIACANLANLLLARGSARQREVAVRLALGASRGRLIRQLMAESLLLAVVGAALGLVLARGLGDFMVGFLSQADTSPLFIDLSPNVRVLGFAAGMVALTCVLFGLAPALRASRTDVGLVLKAAGRSVTDDRARFGLRRVLVVVQVALSFVLIVGALLFTRSLRALTSADPGFRPSGVMVVGFDMRSLDLPKERVVPFQGDVIDRMRAVPGIESAAIAWIVPISAGGWNNPVWREGGPKEPFMTDFNRISSGYFRTMGTPFLAGRDFDSRDAVGAPEVAIINETMAKKLQISGNPIGQRFRRDATETDGERVFEIVGVVRDSKQRELREEFRPLAYFPLAQDEDPQRFTNLLVRSSLPPADVIGAVKRVTGESSPSLRI